MTYRLPDHKSGATLDYQIDFKLWLAYGEPVLGVTVMGLEPSTLTLTGASLAGSVWTCILAGGIAGQLYTLTLHLQLGGNLSGRQEDIVLSIRVLSPAAWGAA